MLHKDIRHKVREYVNSLPTDHIFANPGQTYIVDPGIILTNVRDVSTKDDIRKGVAKIDMRVIIQEDV